VTPIALEARSVVFISHPATGRKALYISRLMSARIEGLSRQESEAALDKLFDISEDAAIIYEHEWRLGDLVIWDNWCSIHAPLGAEPSASCGRRFARAASRI
jgi:taurine dioxygenase